MIIADVLLEKMRNELKEDFRNKLYELKNVGTDKDKNKQDIFMKGLILQHFALNKEILHEEMVRQLLEEEKPLTLLYEVFEDYVYIDTLFCQVFEDYFLNDGESEQEIKELTYYIEDDEDDEEEYDENFDETDEGFIHDNEDC